jgi:hypothetical protein
MDCSLAGVSSSTVVQEDLPIAGMAECDKWTVFFALAVCLVAHIDIYAYIFLKRQITADTPGKYVLGKWTCA